MPHIKGEVHKSFYGSASVDDDLKFDTLVYPTDLNSDTFYPDCICFTIQKRTGVSIDDFVAAGSAGIDIVAEQIDTLRGQYTPKLAKIMNKTIKELGHEPTELQITNTTANVLAAWKVDHPDFTIDPGVLETIRNAVSKSIPPLRASGP